MAGDDNEGNAAATDAEGVVKDDDGTAAAADRNLILKMGLSFFSKAFSRPCRCLLEFLEGRFTFFICHREGDAPFGVLFFIP